MSDLLIRIMADWLILLVGLVGGFGFLVLVKTKKMYETIAKGLVTGLVALLFAKVASILYQGERPFIARGEEPGAAFLNNPGFPSDHALLVFTVTLVIWASTKNIRLSAILLVLSVLISVGRVLALVHTPLDIIGAAICALLAATVIYGRGLYQTK